MTANRKLRVRSRTNIIIAVLITAICILITALSAALFVIDKLNKNNLFIKSVLVDNNYFLSLNDDHDNEGVNAAVSADEGDIAYAMEQLMAAVGEIKALERPMKYFSVAPDGSPVVDTQKMLDDVEADPAARDWFYDLSAARVESGYNFGADTVAELPAGKAYMLPAAVTILYDYFMSAWELQARTGVSADDAGGELYYLFEDYFYIPLPDFDPIRDRCVQLDVPYISQEGILPNGCESVSATMLLQYCGFDIEPEAFVDDYLDCEPVTIRWGCRYGPNPKLRYAGDPRSENDGYGCFAPVIVSALNKYLAGSEYRAKNVSGLSLNMLKSQYINRGVPVAVWATVGMEEIDKIILWQSTDGGESFMYPANEHCMVFVGYDESDGTYIFADPYGSNGIVKYGVDESVLAYNSLNMQAVAIVRK